MSEGKWIRNIGEKTISRDVYYGPYKYLLAAAGVVVSEDDPSMIIIDANGAGRNVDMPAPSANIEGKRWTIINQTAATHALTVRNNGGATIQSIAATKAAEIIVLNVAGTLTWKVINVLA